MSRCDEMNCGYYYKGEDDDFPCCHFEGWTAPCEENDYVSDDEYEEEY